MVDLIHEVANQIKGAIDTNQVESIIEGSFDKSKAGNGIRYGRKNMMIMVMALRYIKAEGLNAKATANINHAIEVFEALRKKDRSNLF